MANWTPPEVGNDQIAPVLRSKDRRMQKTISDIEAGVPAAPLHWRGEPLETSGWQPPEVGGSSRALSGDNTREKSTLGSLAEETVATARDIGDLILGGPAMFAKGAVEAGVTALTGSAKKGLEVGERLAEQPLFKPFLSPLRAAQEGVTGRPTEETKFSELMQAAMGAGTEAVVGAGEKVGIRPESTQVTLDALMGSLGLSGFGATGKAIGKAAARRVEGKPAEQGAGGAVPEEPAPTAPQTPFSEEAPGAKIWEKKYKEQRAERLARKFMWEGASIKTVEAAIKRDPLVGEKLAEMRQRRADAAAAFDRDFGVRQGEVLPPEGGGLEPARAGRTFEEPKEPTPAAIARSQGGAADPRLLAGLAAAGLTYAAFQDMLPVEQNQVLAGLGLAGTVAIAPKSPLGVLREQGRYSTKVLNRLPDGRTDFKKAQIEQELRRPDVGKEEKELLTRILRDTPGDTISANDLMTRFRLETGDHTLGVRQTSEFADYGLDAIDRGTVHDWVPEGEMREPNDVIGPPWVTNLYRLPEGMELPEVSRIAKNGQEITSFRHFDDPRYFAHTRTFTEDGVTHVVELQSDLMSALEAKAVEGSAQLQKTVPMHKNWERRIIREELRRAADRQRAKESEADQWARELTALPEDMPEWHAAVDAYSKAASEAELGKVIRFADADTVAKVEGWEHGPEHKATPEEMLQTMEELGLSPTPAEVVQLMRAWKASGHLFIEPGHASIYNRYKSDVQSYLKSLGGKEVTDQHGHGWIEVPLEKFKGPVEMYGKADPRLLAGLAAAGLTMAAFVKMDDEQKQKVLESLGLAGAVGMIGATRGAKLAQLAKAGHLSPEGVWNGKGELPEGARVLLKDGTEGIVDHSRQIPNRTLEAWNEFRDKLHKQAFQGYTSGQHTFEQATQIFEHLLEQNKERLTHLYRKGEGYLYVPKVVVDGESKARTKLPSEIERVITPALRSVDGGMKESGVADPRLLAGLAAAGITAAAFMELSDEAKERILEGLAIGGVAGITKGKGGVAEALRSVKDRVPVQEAVKEARRGVLGGLADFASRTVGVASTSITHPALKLQARNLEMGIMSGIGKRLVAADPFVRSLRKLPEELQTQIAAALYSGNAAKLSAAFKASGNGMLEKEYTAATKVLKDLGTQLKNAGLISNVRENYFPRIVKDRKGLLESLGLQTRDALEKALYDAERAARNARDYGLTEVESSAIINKFLKGYRAPGTGMGGYRKGRVFEEVTAEMLPYYATPLESLHAYLTKATQDLELAKFFGKDAVKKQVGDAKVIDVDASIGAKVDKLLKAKEITTQEAIKLGDVLRERWIQGEAPMNKAFQFLRDFGYMAYLAQIPAAVRQLGDVALPATMYGWRPTLRSMYRAATGKAEIPLSDLGVTHVVAEELSSPRKMQRLMNASMKFSGFELTDRFGKQVAVDTAMRYWSRKVKSEKGLGELAEKYQQAFGPEFSELVKDLQAGRRTERVNSLIFSELSDIQPVSRLEMPRAYLAHPNGRLLFQMKSWMLKQFDVIRRNVYQEIAKGNTRKGMANFLRYSVFMGMAGATMENIADWILGRNPDFADPNFTEAFLKNFGMSEYLLSKMEGKRPVAEAVASVTVPPSIGVIDQMINADPKIVKSFPAIGQLLYSHEMGGKEEFAKREKQKERREGPAAKRLRERQEARRKAKEREKWRGLVQ